MSDRPRLLHRRSELAYTDSSAQALRGEPEAIDEKTQARFSLAARRAQELRQRDEWRRAHSQISTAIEGFRQSGPIDKPVWNATRAVLRSADAVNRKLGL